MEKKCLRCDDYLDRWKIAAMLGGVWDFELCNKTCWQEEDKVADYNRRWQRAKYRRTHGLAVTK